MAKKQKFPKVLYVYREDDGDESYLICQEDIEGLDNRIIIGVYKLESTPMVLVERSLIKEE